MQCLSVTDGCKTRGLKSKIAAAVSLKWSRCDAQPLLAWERKTERGRRDREKCFKTAWEKERWRERQPGNKLALLRFRVAAVYAANNKSPAKQTQYILKIHGCRVSALRSFFSFFSKAHHLTPESLHKLGANTQKDLGQGKLLLFKGLQRFNGD